MVEFRRTKDRYSLEDFEVRARLGKGAFGSVYLVRLKENHELVFAMKVCNKESIFSQNLTKYAKTERDVLALADHPFVVKMYFAFQNARNVFLLLEYCPGGDLGKVLAKERKFSEEIARIYVCEVLLALEYLHAKNVMYRDLKPDNLMLDQFGHVKLVDFGLSKINTDDGYSSTSFLGTHAYLAPEILANRNYGKSVDWYNLGVLLYEFLVGVPAYYSDNLEKLYENIQSGPIQFPRGMSPEARDLISKLMIRNPMTRLGFNGAQEIKEHPFFSGIVWSNFSKRQADGNYPDVYPPQRKCAKISKKQKEKAAEARAEIEDGDLVLTEGQLKKQRIEKWSFVR